MIEWMPLICILTVFALLLLGFPVGSALIVGSLSVAFFSHYNGFFDIELLTIFPNRLFGVMTNETLIAIPLFILMGLVLEKSRLAEDWLHSLSILLGKMPGASLLAVLFAGSLMAASTGIVGASVVTLSLLAMPNLSKQKHSESLSAGLIAASGTLGQLIPPSIVLILLADVISHAYSEAQLSQGIYHFDTISVGDVFLAAFLPGAMLVGFYAVYIMIKSKGLTNQNTSGQANLKHIFALLPGLVLVLFVLGSIFMGWSTPTEAASVGVFGAMALMLYKKRFSFKRIYECCKDTAILNGMVFYILIGASLFALVFRGLSGDEWIASGLQSIPGGPQMQLITVLLVVFALGFILDFIEITLIVVPLIGPSILAAGIDPLWFTVLLAINLQTSFLTPPFGFSLFYLKGALPHLDNKTIYRGVLPFVFIQLGLLALVYFAPSLVLS